MGVPTGSGPGYRRPVLVIQSNDFNKSKINTVIAAAITSNLKLAKAPGNIFLKKEDSGLPKDSVVNVSQIITLDKEMLTDLVGFLGSRHLKRVETGIKTILSIK